MKSIPPKKTRIVFPDRFTIGTPTPKPDYTVQKPTLEISQSDDGLWYWTLRDTKGGILAVCANGLPSIEACKRAQARVSRNMREAKIVVLDLGD